MAFSFRIDGSQVGKPEGRFPGMLFKSVEHGLDWNRYPSKINLAIENNLQCARDHKWRLTKDVIDRLECDCRTQVLRVLAVWRLWNCTKGWKQEPPWPMQVDPNDWPPWRVGGGPKVDYIQGATKAQRCTATIDFNRKDGAKGAQMKSFTIQHWGRLIIGGQVVR